MLSDIPNINRTGEVLNDIQLQIERFRQLRLKYSVVDHVDNVVNLKTMGNNNNPLIENIYNMKYKLFWMLPVVTNIKKIYYADWDNDNENNTNQNVDIKIMSDLLSDVYSEKELWKSNQHSNEQNKYKTHINKLVNIFKPFMNFII